MSSTSMATCAPSGRASLNGKAPPGTSRCGKRWTYCWPKIKKLYRHCQDSTPDGCADAVKLVERNSQRRHNHHDVAQGPEPNAFGQGVLTHADAASLPPWIRLLRLPIANQFDAGNQTALANVAHMRMLGNPSQMLREPSTFGLQMFQRTFFLKHIERRQRDRRAQWIASISMAMKKRLRFFIAS